MEVAGLMLEHGLGAVMVVDEATLAGIFSARDALFRVVARDVTHGRCASARS